MSVLLEIKFIMPKKIVQNNTEPENRELKLAYWVATNRPLFKKIGKILFLIFDAVLMLYVLYNFVDYLFIGGPREEKAIASLLQNTVNTDIIHNLAARPLDIRSTVVLKSRETYDAASFVKNNNTSWAAKFTYQFVIGGSLKTEPKDGFILPGESKFITDLGIKPPQGKTLSASPQGKFVILDVVWERISSHQIEDYKLWSEQRLNFKITESSFSPEVTFAQGTVSRASFKVLNATAFNYWNVGFKIILYRGAAIVGLNYVTAQEFKTGEIREMEATWVESIGQITKVDIFPEVYILDDSVYMR